MNKVATRIAQTADNGINLIRFMTGSSTKLSS
jgi:hypothetical protein